MKCFITSRGIIWIADAPAHGRRFCGRNNHQHEEPKLEPLVKDLAKTNATLRGFSLNGGASLTFAEMAKIYNETNPDASFMSVEFAQRADFESNVIALGQFVTQTVSASVRDFLSDPPARRAPSTVKVSRLSAAFAPSESLTPAT